MNSQLQMKRAKKSLVDENPWQVQNLEEFLYYCCPECDVKSKDTQSFIEHALTNHEQAQQLVVVKTEQEPLTIDGTIVHLIDATTEHEHDEDDVITDEIQEGKKSGFLLS